MFRLFILEWITSNIQPWLIIIHCLRVISCLVTTIHVLRTKSLHWLWRYVLVIRVKILHVIEVLKIVYNILLKNEVIHYLLKPIGIVVMPCLVDFRGVCTGGWLHLVRAHGETCRYALVGWNDLDLFVCFDTVVLCPQIVVKYLFELLGVWLEITK